MNSWIRAVTVLGIAWLPQSCAFLHSVMLSDVEPRPKSSTPIDVKVSENTVNFDELSAIAKNIGKLKKMKGVGKVSDGLEMYTTFFQWGPRTGTPVFNEYYAQVVPDLLQAKCPGGRVTNIVSIRESREYPVVKGEIIRIKALCHNGKGQT
jgi:hypothetical protein